MADRRHVHAHLVGSAGFQPALDQRRIAQDVEPFPVRYRALAAACPRRSRSSCGWPTSGRAAHRSCPRPPSARPRRSRDSADRCCARRTASPALRARRRSWRPPAAPTCPCRCGGRCPGRATPPIPDRLPPQWWSNALTRVPSRLPAAGWTTSPAGLSTTSRCSSSNTIVERDVLRLVVRRRWVPAPASAKCLVAADLGRGVADRAARAFPARRCGSAPSAARATGSAPRRPARGRAASRHGPARARTSIDLNAPRIPIEYGF